MHKGSMWRIKDLSFSAILLALIVDPLVAFTAYRALRPGGKRVRRNV